MSNRSKTIILLFVDIFILFFALTIVVYSRRLGNLDLEGLLKHYDIFVYIFSFWILMYFIEGLYSLRTYNPLYLPVSLMRGTVISTVLSMVALYTVPEKISVLTPKTVLLLTAMAAVPLLYLWRKSFFNYFSKVSRLRNTCVIGNRETIDLVSDEISKKPYLGYQIITSLNEESKATLPKNIDLIAIERNLPRNTDIYQKVFSLLDSGIQVIDLARFAEQVSGKIPITSIDESWFIEYCGYNNSRSYNLLKSLIDKSIAIILLILLIPLAVIILPVLLLLHGRPIFFKQTRTGLYNKPFVLYKLRTMVIDAEKSGAQWAKPKDARITPLGKVLRKTRLDELPQLINIIKGEMSLVGPRPERPEIIEKQLAPNIAFYNLRHLVKPGVTGWAQVVFRYGFSQEDSKEKLQYDLFYVKNKSIWLDIMIIFKTIKTVITGAGQ